VVQEEEIYLLLEIQEDQVEEDGLEQVEQVIHHQYHHRKEMQVEQVYVVEVEEGVELLLLQQQLHQLLKGQEDQVQMLHLILEQHLKLFIHQSQHQEDQQVLLQEVEEEVNLIAFQDHPLHLEEQVEVVVEQQVQFVLRLQVDHQEQQDLLIQVEVEVEEII
jgi:hypothetical protein